MKSQNIRLSKRITKYLFGPVISQALLFFNTWIAFHLNAEAGYLFLILSILHGLLFLVFVLRMKKHLKQEVQRLSFSVSGFQKEHLYYFDVPHAILDGEGCIEWMNEKLEEIIAEQDVIGKKMERFFTELTEEPLSEDTVQISKEITYADRKYQLLMKKQMLPEDGTVLGEKGRDYYSLFLYDITEIMELRNRSHAQQCAFGYIYMDNYEEVVQSVEESRQPLLTAIVDRNLQKFAADYKAVLKKFEKDKYILVLSREQLELLMEKKMAILDELREVNIGNELPVTVSIGIGIDSRDYLSGLDSARTALDLAMGRGGDQGVVKEGDKTMFFGGKTKGVENTSRVKARMRAYALKEIFLEADNIVIMGHHNPDMDALGAAVGMYVCARELKKEANIIVNNVSSSIKGLYQRLLENDIYKDHVLISNAEAKPLMRENTVLVVVDVNRPSYTEYPEIIPMASKIVVFDHHRTSVEQIENPVLRYVEPYASSTCEMVSEVIRYLSEKIRLHPVEADAILAGITVDTKNFTVKTGIKTFEAAAFLKRAGADITRVRELFRNDMQSYKARAEAVRNSIIYRDCMAISVCPSNIPNPVLVAAQAADELLNIATIRASFVLTQVEETIYLSLRSFDTINVQVIAEKMGGGGHLNMAGAQITGMDMDSAIIMVKTKIDEYMQEGESKDESNPAR